MSIRHLALQRFVQDMAQTEHEASTSPGRHCHNSTKTAPDLMHYIGSSGSGEHELLSKHCLLGLLAPAHQIVLRNAKPQAGTFRAA
jgi:hypothetical protein